MDDLIKSEEEQKDSPKKKVKDKPDSIPAEPKKESIEAFLFRKEKEESLTVSPRLKNVFIKILARHKGNLEKAWSELWA